MKHTEVFEQLKGHLIVSCQALPDEPPAQFLHHVPDGLCCL